MKNNLQAITYMLLHVLMASIINTNYRLLGGMFEKIHISIFCNTFAFLLLLPFAIIFRQYIITSKLWYIHMARAASYAIAQLLLVYSYNNIKFIEVTSITLTYPLIAVLAAAIFLKEKIGITRITALVIGFIGAGIIINPTYGNFNIYSLLALIAVIFWVIFDVLVKRFNEESYFTQFFYLILFMSLFSIIPNVFINTKLPDISNLWIFIPLGIVVMIYMYSALMAVIKTESLGVIMPFYFVNLIISSVVSYCVFNETMNLRNVIGSLLILGSTAYIAYREYKINKLNKQQNILL